MSISLRGVSVRAAGHTVLDSIDLDIAPGSHVAIVGRSGAGKSSLVGLLLGWHRPASGDIFVDGRPVTEETLPALRSQIAWVDPTVHLWNESLEYNIGYAAAAPDGGSGGRSRAASRTDAVIERLSGMQGSLGEAGGLLSGGEGQRVRLGRALMNTRRAPRDPGRGVPRSRPAGEATTARSVARAVAGRDDAVRHARHQRHAIVRSRARHRERPHRRRRLASDARGRSANRGTPGCSRKKMPCTRCGRARRSGVASTWTTERWSRWPTTGGVNGMTNARSVTWPAARLDEAVAALARAAGCLAADRDAPPLVDGTRSPDAVIERTAARQPRVPCDRRERRRPEHAVPHGGAR